MVSVFMLAYNQEEYIAQAIEGVLMQKTDFLFQLVIGEDHSTDRTRTICINYAEKYPDRIKLILNENNIGLGANYVKTYKECTGRYVAICDGDDFWIDPLKLQKQVNFLIKNSSYSIIYTNNQNLLPNGRIEINEKLSRKTTTSFYNLVRGNFIVSATCLFKRVPLTERMEKWMKDFPYGDWQTYLLITKDGSQIYFLNEVTAVYRKNFGTSTKLREKRSMIGEINLNILKNLLEGEEFSYRKEDLQLSILEIKKGLMASYIKEHSFFKSILFYFDLTLKVKIWELTRIYAYSFRRLFE